MNQVTSIKSDEATPLAPARRGLTRGQKILLGALPVAVAGGLYFANAQSGPADAAPPPATVTAAAPVVRQITEWDDYSGRFEASRSVEVRPRVSGAITGVHFQDGAYVRQGQLLFTIDARPFAAALAEAQAAVQSARSDLSLASADLGRATRLLEVDARSEEHTSELQSH